MGEAVYFWKDKFVSKEEVNIDIFDKGYQYGDGIYEVVHVYNGNLFTLTEHVDRLFNSAKKIELNLKSSPEKVKEILKKLVEKNEIKHGYVYLQVTRGDNKMRNHKIDFYEDQEPVFSGFGTNTVRDTEKIYSVSSAITYPDLRGKMCDVKSLNLIPNVLAMYSAQKKNARKAILVNDDGIVTEEKSGNLLIVKDDTIYTHPDGRAILPGITKEVIKKKCKKHNVSYIEKKFTLEEMLNADEVVVVDTNTECAPISHIDDVIIGDGSRGEMAKRIQKMYEEAIIEECGSL